MSSVRSRRRTSGVRLGTYLLGPTPKNEQSITGVILRARNSYIIGYSIVAEWGQYPRYLAKYVLPAVVNMRLQDIRYC